MPRLRNTPVSRQQNTHWQNGAAAATWLQNHHQTQQRCPCTLLREGGDHHPQPSCASAIRTDRTPQSRYSWMDQLLPHGRIEEHSRKGRSLSLSQTSALGQTPSAKETREMGRHEILASRKREMGLRYAGRLQPIPSKQDTHQATHQSQGKPKSI